MPVSKNRLAQGIENLICQSQIVADQANNSIEQAATCQEYDFDVIIIGSGYGGAVAASRLARARQADGTPLKIAVLERGAEYQAGDFPNSFAQIPGEVRLASDESDGAAGNTQGLLDFHFNRDVSVLRGNGLGGGSLINASVVEEIAEELWQAAEWPLALRRNVWQMRRYAKLVKLMLQAKPLPMEKWPAKTWQLKRLGEAIGQQPGAPAQGGFRALDLALNQQDQRNPYGIEQSACKHCGDCFTGCNFNAKNSLNMNYLPDAKRFGAQIYTGASVRWLERLSASHGKQTGAQTTAQQEPGWQVHFALSEAPNANSQAQTYTLRARMVVLAAGSLGSTEILLRSKAHGLSLSATLGTRFSGNGDMIWAGYQQDQEVKPGAQEYTPFDQRAVGPTITAMLDLRQQSHANVRYPKVLQDAAIPGALYRVFAELIGGTELLYRMAQPCADELQAQDTHQSDPDAINQQHLQHTALYLSMGRDQACGRIEWEASEQVEVGKPGKLRIVWPNAGRQALYEATEYTLATGVATLGGTLLASPAWRAYPRELETALSGKKPGGNLFTVHPLGGCPMADNVHAGVVDHRGAVFDGQTADSVHADLYVWDGAIIPLAVGINPLLSIAALAERAVRLCIKQHQWQMYKRRLPAHAGKSAKLTKDAEQANDDIGDVGDVENGSLATIATPKKPITTEFKFAEEMLGSLRLHPRFQTNQPNDPANAPLATNQSDFTPGLQVNFLFDIPLQEFLQDPKRSLKITDAWLSLPNGEKIAVEGEVHWLHLVPSWHWKKVSRALWTYGRMRAWPDVYAKLHQEGITAESQQAFFPRMRKLPRLWQHGRSLLNLASHTGCLRELRYLLRPKPGQRGVFAEMDWQLRGIKRVEYTPTSNLWVSLSDLHVEIRNQRHQRLAHGVLRLDWVKLLRQKSMQLVKCEENPYAWLDMASVAGFFLRSVFRIHFWNFRKPDYSPIRRTFPRPGDLPGLIRRWHVVPISGPQLPAKDLPRGKEKKRALPCVELNHYRAENIRQTQASHLPPVLLIHGFGASGLQFTTDAMPENLCQHLCKAGREVWVLDLRTSIALPSHAQQWSLDEVAQSDIPSAVRHVLAHYQGRYAALDVIAHCIGSAMFNIAVLSGRLQAANGLSLIRAAVMLQVGPIFKVSKSNRIRGAFAETMRDFLAAESIASSIDEASAKAEDVLLDRLLASHPLPLAEAMKLRPRLGQAPRTDIANYLRSTGVFGRLFELDNLSPQMRENLGELLGATNLKTYQQILHAVLAERLMDQYGRNVYVTDENAYSFYRFPALFAFGEQNDVFDRACTEDSKNYLNQIFQNDCFTWHEFKGFGHLDPLVGQHAARDVFPIFSDFLRDAPAFKLAARLPAQEATAAYLRQPAELGPILGWTRPAPQKDDSTGELLCRVWLKLPELSQANAMLESMLLDEQGRYRSGSYQQHALLHYPGLVLAVVDIRLPALKPGQAPWQMLFCSCHHARPTNVQKSPAPQLIPALPEAAVILQALQDQAASQTSLPNLSDVQSEQAAQAMWRAYQTTPALFSVAQAQAGVYQACQQAALCMQTNQPSQPKQPQLCIALGSCRYSGSNLEVEMADAAFAALLQHQAQAQANTNLDWQAALCLMMGDQIYVDATAGVMENGQRPELIQERYQDAYRSPHAKAFFSQIPCYKMLDDHEIINDFETILGNVSQYSAQWVAMAQACFIAYQWAHSPGNGRANNSALVGIRQAQNKPIQASQPHHLWYSFETGGMPFFVLDTRLERGPRHPRKPGCTIEAAKNDSRLISEAQMQALSSWLAACQTKYGDRPKFIVSPSVLAPILQEHSGHMRSHNDGWYAYPQSMLELRDSLLAGGIQNAVMLSGDLHACFANRITLSNPQGQQAVLHSLVFSPQYAPYSFINNKAEDMHLQWQETALQAMGDGFAYEDLWHDDRYQGFGLLRVAHTGAHWRLQVRAPGRGEVFCQIDLLG